MMRHPSFTKSLSSKVVAYPSAAAGGGGVGVSAAPVAAPLDLRREAAHAPPVISPPRVHPNHRPRSVSAGRSRTTRGSDLVQDVYDRLGVRRDNLAEPVERGRTSEASQPRTRARSLSRGREVMNSRWPPSRDASKEPQVTTTTSPLASVDSWKDEKKEDDSHPLDQPTLVASSSEQQHQPVSLKERMSAYNRTKAVRPTVRQVDSNYAKAFRVREKKPKIDIYGTKSQDEEEAEDVAPVEATEERVIPPPKTTSTIRSGPTSFVPTISTVQSGSSSTGSTEAKVRRKSKLADAFLASVQQQQHHQQPKAPSPPPSQKSPPPVVTTAPISEIENHGAGDSHSIALSSVSADEFSPWRNTSHYKRPSWSDRNRVVPVKPQAAVDLERLVEERVAAATEDLHAKLAEALQRIQVLEDKLHSA